MRYIYRKNKSGSYDPILNLEKLPNHKNAHLWIILGLWIGFTALSILAVYSATSNLPAK